MDALPSPQISCSYSHFTKTSRKRGGSVFFLILLSLLPIRPVHSSKRKILEGSSHPTVVFHRASFCLHVDPTVNFFSLRGSLSFHHEINFSLREMCGPIQPDPPESQIT